MLFCIFFAYKAIDPGEFAFKVNKDEHGELNDYMDMNLLGLAIIYNIRALDYLIGISMENPETTVVTAPAPVSRIM